MLAMGRKVMLSSHGGVVVGDLTIPSWLWKQNFSKLHNSKARPQNLEWNWKPRGDLCRRHLLSIMLFPEQRGRYLGITVGSDLLLQSSNSLRTRWPHHHRTLGPGHSESLESIGETLGVSSIPCHLLGVPHGNPPRFVPFHYFSCHNTCLKWTRSLYSNFRLENFGPP